MAGSNSKRASRSRAGIGFDVFLQSICVLFLVIAANYVGFNYYKRWDFSRSQKFTLADQTEAVLRQLQSPAKVIIYFSSTSLGPDAALYADVQNLLAQYAFSARRKVDVQQVDPARDVATARELQQKYQFDGTQNLLVLDYDGRTKLIPIVDLAEFDMSGIQSGEPVRLVEFKGEAVLTTALIELLNPKKAKIYFVQNHGETRAGDLGMLTTILSKQNTEAMGLNLAAVGHVPEDADAVAIIGARYDLEPQEITMLEDYWAAHGRLVLLLDPTANTPNFRLFLNGVGIHPRNDRVQRRADSATQRVFTILPWVDASFVPDSPYTKRLVGAIARLPGATQSLLLDDAGAREKDIQLRPLLRAIEGYWGEHDYTDRQSVGVEYNDGVDTGEPVIVGVSAEKGAAKDDRTDVAISRLVAVGNSAFIEDDALRQSSVNLDFILSVFNRMLEGRTKLVGIYPKSAASFSLSLTEAQIRGIAFYTLIVIPGAAALLGLIMAWRRRQ